MKKLTVTIGIPAYNEEQNIGHLLRRLLAQRETFFSIEKIIVISDASTDATDAKVKSIKDDRIQLVKNSRRMGQSTCQNKIFEMSKSDVVVLFESDTLPRGRNFLARLLEPFAAVEYVDFVYSNIVPVPSASFVGNTVALQYSIFHSLYVSNFGLQEHFASGRSGRAFSRNVYTKLRWPKDVPEDVYALLWLRQHGYKTRFAQDAVSFFRCPETIKDFLYTFSKIYSGRRALTNYFPKALIAKRYKVPRHLTLACMGKLLFSSPIAFVAYVFLRIYSLLLFSRASYTDMWEISLSTKLPRAYHYE